MYSKIETNRIIRDECKSPHQTAHLLFTQAHLVWIEDGSGTTIDLQLA
jgi:hypothetical protein